MLGSILVGILFPPLCPGANNTSQNLNLSNRNQNPAWFHYLKVSQGRFSRIQLCTPPPISPHTPLTTRWHSSSSRPRDLVDQSAYEQLHICIITTITSLNYWSVTVKQILDSHKNSTILQISLLSEDLGIADLDYPEFRRNMILLKLPTLLEMREHI